MVKSGRVSMKEISVYLGHKTINVTDGVYEKYSPYFMKESANVIGGFYFLKQGQKALRGIRHDLDEMSRVFCCKVFHFCIILYVIKTNFHT